MTLESATIQDLLETRKDLVQQIGVMERERAVLICLQANSLGVADLVPDLIASPLTTGEALEKAFQRALAGHLQTAGRICSKLWEKTPGLQAEYRHEYNSFIRQQTEALGAAVAEMTRRLEE